MANATFSGTTAGCLALGIGVGTANFWNAGAFGVALGGICEISAYNFYRGQVKQCSYQYYDCTH